MLSKALIKLSADEWGCTPSLVVVWPEATQPWCLENLCQEGPSWPAAASVPVVSPCRPRPPQETLQHEQVVQSPVGLLLLSSGSWYMQNFVCAFQDWSLSFSQSNRSPIIKSHTSQVTDPQTGKQKYQSSVVKVLSPMSGFPVWGSDKETGI